MEIDWEELDLIQHNQTVEFGMQDFALESMYVQGEGDNPKAFILGEAPGAQEVIAGRPFVGPAGNVLRQLMAVAGLHTKVGGPNGAPTAFGERPNCWLTNTVKFRPPGNRQPTDDEIHAARPYLQREWVAVGSPRVIVLVGGNALYAITGVRQSILRAAGKMHTALSKTDGQPLYVWPMVHPSFGLRNPGVQPLLEQDWQKLGDWLATHR